MRRLFLLLAAITICLSVLPALAVQPDEILNDPALERRAREISTGLRCLVCQNQSIDDSEAPLAKDLRILVRDRLKAGDTDAEVRDFVVQRYGEFVLLKPRFRAQTMLLWLTPAAVLAIGALSLLWVARRRRAVAGIPLSAEEEAELDLLLKQRQPGPANLTRNS